MSKYETISNEMRKRIMEEVYSADHPIPDEISLSKEFGVSRMTMKKALDILVLEGLLYRKRGHGTFIIKSAIQNNLVNVVDTSNVGLTNLLGQKKVESKIIHFDVCFPTEEIASHLSLSPDEPVYHIRRLRNVDGLPYVLEETYMPAHLIKGINQKVLHSSVYNHIQGTLGFSIGGSHRKIRASKPNEFDRVHLECAPDDPVLEVEQVAYLNTGIPFEYSFSRHRYDKFVFTTVNIRR